MNLSEKNSDRADWIKQAEREKVAKLVEAAKESERTLYRVSSVLYDCEKERVEALRSALQEWEGT